MTFSEFREQVDAYVMQTWQLSETASAKSDHNGIFAFPSPRTDEVVYTHPPIPPHNMPGAKELTEFMLRTLVTKLELPHTCLITEAWALKADVDNKEEQEELRAFIATGQSYSKHPKAKEILFLSYSTIELPHAIAISYEIDRSTGYPILVKSHEIATEADQTEIAGRFSGLYYDPGTSCK
jgi:hypothetical protein